jgi:hypothetical protein
MSGPEGCRGNRVRKEKEEPFTQGGLKTSGQEAEAHGKEPLHDVLALIKEAEPYIYDHIEQLDGVLVLLSEDATTSFN